MDEREVITNTFSNSSPTVHVRVTHRPTGLAADAEGEGHVRTRQEAMDKLRALVNEATGCSCVTKSTPGGTYHFNDPACPAHGNTPKRRSVESDMTDRLHKAIYDAMAKAGREQRRFDVADAYDAVKPIFDEQEATIRSLAETAASFAEDAQGFVPPWLLSVLDEVG